MKKEDRKIMIILDFSLLLFLPIITLFIIELISREGIYNLFVWINDNINEFILSYLLCFSLINIFFIINRKFHLIYWTLLTLTLSLLTFISNIKVKYRGEPINPWDLKLGKEAVEVSGYFFKSLSLPIILFSLALIIVFVLLIYFIPNKKYDYKNVIIVLLSISIIIVLFTEKPIHYKEKMGIQYIAWDQQLHYNHNGFLFGFFQTTQKMLIKKPNNYTESNVGNVIAKHESNNVYEINQDFKPNIIYIMSEAFWDPTVLNNVKFSEDPIPFFHKLQRENINGTLLSHIYGGATVNTEFEALTGFTTQFLPPGTLPYVHYIHEPTHSIAWILKAQGYNTSAIHTYSNWFYKRDIVYRLLGFDTFTSFEFLSNPIINGEFVKDVHLTDNIVERLKQTDGPDFIHAVSMEAHGPYPSQYPENNLIKVEGDLSNSSREILESYVSKINGADKALEKLVNELVSLDEPTIILFFGDHLPALGSDYQVYKETNYFNNTIDYEDYLKMYSLPFVIWDNFSNKKDDIRMTANFFSPYILNMAKKERTSFFNLVGELYNSGIEVIPKSNYYKDENIDEKVFDDYKLIQHDMLFGKRYYSDRLITFDKNDSYTLSGIFKMEITEVIPKKIRNDMLFNPKDGKHRITIKGVNIPHMAVAYIDDEKLSTNVISGNEMIVALPEKFLEKKDTIDININVVDVQNTILDTIDTIKVEKISGNKVIKELKENLDKKILDHNLSWETFIEAKEYFVVRVKLDLPSDTNYLLFNGEEEIKHSNADEFDKANLSDIYENGYLYISIPKEQVLDNDIIRYFKNNPYILYY